MMVAYLDEIDIVSKNLEERKSHLKEMFQDI